jgi:hypothetical protein
VRPGHGWSARRNAIVVIVALLGAVCAPPAALTLDAQARKKPKRHCTTRVRKNCVRVPANARRPPRVDPQGSQALVPKNVVNGGGIGGGPNRRIGARDWTAGETAGKRWAYRSEGFAEAAFATHGRFATPAIAARSLRLHRGAPAQAPVGTLILFAADSVNRGLGHVGISLGHGLMISALDVVDVTDVQNTPYWRQIYLGWADSPASWPGRIPLPADLPQQSVGAEPVEFLAPAFDATIGTVVRLVARRVNGGAVAFSAYYSDDPLHDARPAWHDLGRGSDVGGAQTLDWGTAGVPDQGSRRLGTVTVAAIAVDDAGNEIGVGEYRRVTVRNHGP